MDQKIQWAVNHMPKTDDKNLPIMGLEEIGKARTFHESFPQYSKTPLTKLDHMAEYLGVKEIYLKDESYRFGLNAFKVLGGSFAMARYIASETGKDVSELPYSVLTSDQLRKEFGQATFFTATDGNHGRAVAWTAQQLGKKAVIYMPKGSDPARLENIRSHGAEASITDLNYDDAVRLAWKMACENGWIMVQDTAWDGYEDIPTWIIQGYAALAVEALAQWRAEELEPPTHLFLQAGVGSFASGVLGYMASELGDALPKTIIVEPHAADCIYRSAIAGDGQPHNVTGDLSTLMAGLACGEPCTVSWPILQRGAAAFVSCGDEYAARGMRLLGRPEPGDPAIISGESGAVGVGVLAAILCEEGLEDLRWTLGLNENSRVLCISTEGDTDRENYRRVLDGARF